MKTKETDITKMSLGQIAWYVIYDHRVILLILSNVTMVTLWVVNRAPTVAYNLTH